MNGTKRHDAKIVSVNIGTSNITRVHHSCLIHIILFIVVDNVYLDFSVTRRDTFLVDSTKRFKSIEVVYFLQLNKLSILPVGASIISIKHHFLFMVRRNLHPKLDLHCITFLLSLGIIGEAVHLLSFLHISAELLPSSLVNEVIIMCILGKVYWVILPHH